MRQQFNVKKHNITCFNRVGVTQLVCLLTGNFDNLQASCKPMNWTFIDNGGAVLASSHDFKLFCKQLNTTAWLCIDYQKSHNSFSDIYEIFFTEPHNLDNTSFTTKQKEINDAKINARKTETQAVEESHSGSAEASTEGREEAEDVEGIGYHSGIVLEDVTFYETEIEETEDAEESEVVSSECRREFLPETDIRWDAIKQPKWSKQKLIDFAKNQYGVELKAGKLPEMVENLKTLLEV